MGEINSGIIVDMKDVSDFLNPRLLENDYVMFLMMMSKS